MFGQPIVAAFARGSALRSAVIAERPPELGPGPAGGTADEDIGMVAGLLMDQAVPVPGASGNAAAVKLLFHPVLRAADNDERFRWRATVAALPEGIDAAPGRRKSVGRAVEVDRARGTVITGK